MKVLSAQANHLDFTPGLSSSTIDMSDAQTIVERAIIEGSGGPDNVSVTMAGLRLIRHFLSLMPADCFCLPNFKNRDTITAAARLFIQSANNPAEALEQMQAVMSPKDCVGDWQ